MSLPIAVNGTTEAAVAAVVLVLLIVSVGWLERRPHKLNIGYFAERWSELQKFCAEPATWPLAIINADKLLDEALKKRRFRGKTMGERLVAAQHALTDNDGAWYAHKLRNRLVHETVNLKKGNVQEALVGFRDALKDLGALK